MKKHLASLGLILAISFVFSNSAFAEKHEIVLGHSGAGGLVGGATTGANLAVGGGDAIFGLAGAYYYTLMQFIQLGVMTNLLVANSLTVFSLLPSATFNIPIDQSGGSWTKSLFVSASPGFLIAAGSASFLLDIAFGGRLPITSDFLFRPSLGFQIVNSSFLFVVRPLTFSVAL